VASDARPDALHDAGYARVVRLLVCVI